MAFIHSNSRRLKSCGPRHCPMLFRVEWDKVSIAFRSVLAISFEPLEERPAKHRVVAGPTSFDIWIGAQDHLHRLNLAVQVVEAMEDQRFGKHGQLGAAKLMLAMMRDDEVLDEGLKLPGEVFDLGDLLVHNFELQNHVSQELSFIRIAKTAGIGQLLGFSNVVNDSARQQKVQINSLIILYHQLAELAKRKCMLEQAPKPGMME